MDSRAENVPIRVGLQKSAAVVLVLVIGGFLAACSKEEPAPTVEQAKEQPALAVEQPKQQSQPDAEQVKEQQERAVEAERLQQIQTARYSILQAASELRAALEKYGSLKKPEDLVAFNRAALSQGYTGELREQMATGAWNMAMEEYKTDQEEGLRAITEAFHSLRESSEGFKGDKRDLPTELLSFLDDEELLKVENKAFLANKDSGEPDTSNPWRPLPDNFYYWQTATVLEKVEELKLIEEGLKNPVNQINR